MNSSETFDVDSITAAAATFLCRIFRVEPYQSRLQESLSRICSKSWNVNKPMCGSGSRTLVFDYGNLDERFLQICIHLGIKDKVIQSRHQFLHDFNVHMDPTSCNVVFNWGYLARDTNEITLFPGSGLHSYKTIIRDRLNKSPSVSVKALSTSVVSSEGVDVEYTPHVDGLSDSASESSRGSSPALSDSSDCNVSPSKASQYIAPIENLSFGLQSTVSTQGYNTVPYNCITSQYSPVTSVNYSTSSSSTYRPVVSNNYSSAHLDNTTQSFSPYQQCASEYSYSKYSKPTTTYYEDVSVMA